MWVSHSANIKPQQKELIYHSHQVAKVIFLSNTPVVKEAMMAILTHTSLTFITMYCSNHLSLLTNFANPFLHGVSIKMIRLNEFIKNGFRWHVSFTIWVIFALECLRNEPKLIEYPIEVKHTYWDVYHNILPINRRVSK